MSISGIYKITNTVNQKIYVGSTVNFAKRIKSHLWGLRHGKHGNEHLQKSYNKYGEKSFIFELLEICEVDKLLEREQYWITLLKVTDHQKGYNKNPIAGTTAGRSPDIVAKTIKTRHQKYQVWHSPETIAKIKKSCQEANFKHSEDTKKKISLASKKMIETYDPASWQKMAKTKKGKPILKCRKPVYCVELDRLFESIGAAADTLGLHRTGISMVLSGVIKQTGGYTFRRFI